MHNFTNLYFQLGECGKVKQRRILSAGQVLTLLCLKVVHLFECL